MQGLANSSISEIEPAPARDTTKSAAAYAEAMSVMNLVTTIPFRPFTASGPRSPKFLPVCHITCMPFSTSLRMPASMLSLRVRAPRLPPITSRVGASE